MSMGSSMGGPPRGGEGGLTASDVAGMAFGCLAECLTETYRAASSYYGGQQSQYQYPSVSGARPSDYQRVSGYSNAERNGPDDSGGGYHGDSKGGYGGYQAKFSDNPAAKEVMDRGIPRQQNASQSSGQETDQRTAGQRAEPQEEWATVQVPSTYQGGKVGV